jgi:hypothetical protein
LSCSSSESYARSLTMSGRLLGVSVANGWRIALGPDQSDSQRCQTADAFVLQRLSPLQPGRRRGTKSPNTAGTGPARRDGVFRGVALPAGALRADRHRRPAGLSARRILLAGGRTRRRPGPAGIFRRAAGDHRTRQLP